MCIFCKIVNQEIPNKTVLESEDFLAFEDINPQAQVHVLVIPKKHIESFEQVDESLMAQMTKFIQEVSKKLKLDSKGYRMITNIGADSGQEVPHLHFHLLGGQKLGALL